MNYLILYFLLAINYSTGKPDRSKVYYKERVNITWGDFKKVKKLEDAKAITSTGISYDYDSQEGVKVYCILYKDASYVQTSNVNPYLLNHEQRHFDITYLYAMRFTNLLKSNPNLTESQISDSYNQIIKQWDAEQEKYDTETDNSINEEKQAEWDARIDKQLKEL